MATVNVSQSDLKAEISQSGGVTRVVTGGDAITVTASTTGPQGVQGPAGSGFTLIQNSKVDKSVVYYDASSDVYRADNIHTVETITDAGNF